jgi:two-component system response regulator (stage 0 sporulation protein F)
MEQKKVLLIDDEADFIEPMAFWLQSKGYLVSSTTDSKNGIRLIEQENPDILFLDLNMPVMTGIEVLQRIRKINKDLPVIIISAYADQDKIKQAEKYGVSGVFYKGMDYEQSLSLLEAVLRRHKKLKE